MKKVKLNKLVEVIVLYCNVNGLRISPLKLQKIVYYIQAWHIVKFNKNTLFDELPEAWVNGPVYRSIYDDFKVDFFRSDDISLNIKGDLGGNLSQKVELLKLTNKQEGILFSVLKFYAPKDAGSLVLKTHSDKPWNDARKDLKPFERSRKTISVESMHSFYSAISNK
jgi:uncharacterized phage-associated protein